MKRFSIIFCVLFVAASLVGQKQIVEWRYDTEAINDQEVLLTFSAEIVEGWKLYSQFTEAGGPLPTKFTLVPGDGVELVGQVKEVSKPKTARSDLFEIDVTSFTDKAQFTQVIKTKDGGSKINATIKYMCCDGVKCIPPTEKNFKITL